MWKLFKTDEEKEQINQQRLVDLQKEVDKLNVEYKNIINTFCQVRCYVFIFKGFAVNSGKIKFNYIDNNTPKGYTNSRELYWFKEEFGINIFQARSTFIGFKGNLEKLGIELKLLNTNKEK